MPLIRQAASACAGASRRRSRVMSQRIRKMEQIVPDFVSDYARELFQAHGDKAIAEAAQKAAAMEKRGDEDQARTWRRIEAALKELAGPHQP